MEFLTEFGYLGLFAASFIAATLLPMSSELVLTVLLANDFDPTILILVATVGNTLGAITSYAIGYWSGPVVAKKMLRVSDEDFTAATARFKKYGTWSLLLAWVPIIGDPITLVAGVLRVQLLWFITLVALAKFARYLVITLVVLELV